METNITNTINHFIEFLNINWDDLNNKIKGIEYKDEWQKRDLLCDWLQFNWELLVESFICKNDEYLISYGTGAECNKGSDRVRFPKKKVSHKIICKSKTNTLPKDYLSNNLMLPEDKEFYKFVSYNGDFYSDSAPFDFTLMQDDLGEYYLFKNEEIIFFKIRIES